MGENTYIAILIQSLQKKNKILDVIIQKNKEQREGLEDPNLDPDDFDVCAKKLHSEGLNGWKTNHKRLFYL